MAQQHNTPEALYQNVMDALPEGILFCDTDYIIRVVNQCYAELLGGDPQSVVGKPLPELNPATRAAIVIKKGKPELGDLCTLPLSGNTYKFIVNRVPVRNDEGTIIGMLSHIIFTDPRELQNLHKKVDSLYNKLNFYKNSIKSILKSNYDIDCIIGKSAVIRDVKTLIRSYAAQMHPILVQGETGTGKELAAHALHAESERAEGPFISINCAAIPKELYEAELFGYAAGAFSGAHKDGKIGQVELANNGTLFLDEIGDMPLHAQVKLLRLLEEKQVTRVGAVSARKVDFRLITATNRDLRAMIEQGTFREDLYYRISTLSITLPPLRERVDDIIPISHHILSRIGYARLDFSERAREAMEAYPWPGNVRQLFNSLAHASIHCREDTIDVADLPSEVAGSEAPRKERKRSSKRPTLSGYLATQEAEFLDSMLRENRGNIAATARKLGVSRVTLYGKLKKYGIAGHKAAENAEIPPIP